MKKKFLLTANMAGLLSGAALLTWLTGCLAEGSYQRGGYRGSQQVQTTVMFQDDYDYYPGYETYYSRNRHEYVYREGNSWVRRSEPRGVTASVLLVAPSVRMDFRDSPEQHHSTVVRSYPKDWKRPDQSHPANSRKDNKTDKQDEKNDRKDDRKGEDRKN